MSKPPTFEIISMGSPRSGAWSDIALSIAAIFRLNPSALSPAPLPVINFTGISVNTDATALLVVVFPIPISPVAKISYDFDFNIPTISIPVRIARIASVLVMAASRVIFFVPGAILYSFFVTPGTSDTIPISIGNRSTPAIWAILHTLVSLFVKFSATTAVTSCPVCVTPSSTTPLSAHMMTRPFLSKLYAGLPFIPAIFVTASSNFPRLNKGFAICFHRFFACAAAFWSGGQICSRYSFSRFVTFSNSGSDCSFIFFLSSDIWFLLCFFLFASFSLANSLHWSVKRFANCGQDGIYKWGYPANKLPSVWTHFQDVLRSGFAAVKPSPLSELSQ